MKTPPPIPALPAPACALGYTRAQVVEIMGPLLAEFDSWMVGQTHAFCEGRRWDRARHAYIATGEGPHGLVAYPHDVIRFLATRTLRTGGTR